MKETFDLQPALSATREEIAGSVGPISFYYAAPDDPDDAAQRPLLLIHSVNAAASAYEVKPLFDHYRHRRPVAAIDLPGYGFSARPAQKYTPRVMTDAIHQLAMRLVADHDNQPIDVVALSLSAEFAARAANEWPQAFATLGFISPTGFSGDKVQRGAPGSTRGISWLYKGLTASKTLGQGTFDALTSKRSIRYFLAKTWGSKQIDEGAFEYAYATAHQPGARFAPFSFLSGFLFSADITDVYGMVRQPVWMAHGDRGDFTDYRRKIYYGHKPNWQIDAFPTGALPHFECRDRITSAYDQFLDVARSGGFV